MGGGPPPTLAARSRIVNPAGIHLEDEFIRHARVHETSPLMTTEPDALLPMWKISSRLNDVWPETESLDAVVKADANVLLDLTWRSKRALINHGQVVDDRVCKQHLILVHAKVNQFKVDTFQRYFNLADKVSRSFRDVKRVYRTRWRYAQRFYGAALNDPTFVLAVEKLRLYDENIKSINRDIDCGLFACRGIFFTLMKFKYMLENELETLRELYAKRTGGVSNTLLDEKEWPYLTRNCGSKRT